MSYRLIRKVLILFLVTSMTFFSCSKQEDHHVITVAASPVPHAAILEQAKVLLAKEGYELRIMITNDYITPNLALTSNSVDANFFQHVPYLHQYNIEHHSSIVPLDGIFLAPIGIYSKRVSKDYPLLDQLNEGDVILMSNSITDQSRLLTLLQSVGILELHANTEGAHVSFSDIKSIQKNLVIRNDIAPELLTSMYKNNEAALILINGNFALDAGLNPLEDAILLESTHHNPYANVVATLPKHRDSTKMKALMRALQSDKIRQFIIATYKGSIVPIKNDN
ncbi:MetQ/NlpA family ABC transporter substrate-binding protein [Entomospira entomophila]|uniref:Methionine ABC transporter substrate-binding protein n=1 Tax=Entomospira entomophila TaxID=2719988 RepID=A0A968KRP0_9SPIO|nr:MetQ/NlpA family ABC transporter substrate-binding protein [Entomospira entomophilus]NIZ40948.1 methionine ABC transporter substrate-binding protein [Entomospira entomophilus]WDI35161.1 MetQ/NlpA family ABC transporter substrate-binding protein [Entomospira entomophilus]